MFADGNNGFVRLMVKTLIPDAFAGPRTVDDVWRNRIKFAALDRAGSQRAFVSTPQSCASSTRAVRRAHLTW